MALIPPVILLIVTAGLLLWQFPLGVTMTSVQTYVSVTERSYMVMVGLFPVLGIVANLLTARYLRAGRLTRMVATLLLSLLFGAAVCFGLGHWKVEIPMTHMQAIFFANRKYRIVFYAIVVPVSCVTALLTGVRSLWLMSGGEPDV